MLSLMFRARLVHARGLSRLAHDTIASPYGTAFPIVPRIDGCARVTISSSMSTQTPQSVLKFVSRQAAADAIRKQHGDLAAADAANESVVVLSTGTSRTLLAVVADSTANNELGFGGSNLPNDSLRAATVAGIQRARALKLADLHIEMPSESSAAAASAVAQAAVLSNYSFDRYLSAGPRKPWLLSHLHLYSPHGESVKSSVEMAHGAVLARDLANERSDEMNPERLEAVALALAAEFPGKFRCTVVKGEEQLREHRLDLLAAVGQAARHGPRYIELEYLGNDQSTDKIAVVGKGITYDTGGLNLKPTGSIEDMHMDMGGAAAVLGCCRTVARLGVQRNVVFVLAVAENAIGSRAYKPHAVVRSHAGKTVQISNTDAEGRLVLADALSLVRQRHSPDVIIDMATLTGACMVALGEYAAGLFSNDSKLSQQLAQSGQQVAERLWPMPILPEHMDEITKGVEQADLKSTGAGRNGGACTASAFLHQFAVEPAQSGGSTKPVRWAHLDIAGPAMYSKSRGFMCAGGTGFGAQTVTQFIVNYTKL